MQDPNALLHFIFQILQYGGACVAAIYTYTWVKAGKDKDQEARDNAQWGILGGITAFVVGIWLSNMTFPTL